MVALSISIDVPDMPKAVAFYTQALGCEPVREHNEKWVVIGANGVEIHLQTKAEGSAPIPLEDADGRKYARHWTPIHLDFLISDVGATVAKVEALDGTYEGGDKGDWGEIAHCADPFGNGFLHYSGVGPQQ